ncbi:hypothetical protein AYI70_g3788, partial [Smittium culicis]
MFFNKIRSKEKDISYTNPFLAIGHSTQVSTSPFDVLEKLENVGGMVFDKYSQVSESFNKTQALELDVGIEESVQIPLATDYQIIEPKTYEVDEIEVYSEYSDSEPDDGELFDSGTDPSLFQYEYKKPNLNISTKNTNVFHSRYRNSNNNDIESGMISDYNNEHTMKKNKVDHTPTLNSANHRKREMLVDISIPINTTKLNKYHDGIELSDYKSVSNKVDSYNQSVEKRTAIFKDFSSDYTVAKSVSFSYPPSVKDLDKLADDSYILSESTVLGNSSSNSTLTNFFDSLITFQYDSSADVEAIKSKEVRRNNYENSLMCLINLQSFSPVKYKYFYALSANLLIIFTTQKKKDLQFETENTKDRFIKTGRNSKKDSTAGKSQSFDKNTSQVDSSEEQAMVLVGTSPGLLKKLNQSEIPFSLSTSKHLLNQNANKTRSPAAKILGKENIINAIQIVSPNMINSDYKQSKNESYSKIVCKYPFANSKICLPKITYKSVTVQVPISRSGSSANSPSTEAIKSQRVSRSSSAMMEYMKTGGSLRNSAVDEPNFQKRNVVGIEALVLPESIGPLISSAKEMDQSINQFQELREKVLCTIGERRNWIKTRLPSKIKSDNKDKVEKENQNQKPKELPIKDLNEKPKEQPKGDLEEKPLEQPKEQPKEDLKEKPKEQPKEQPKDSEEKPKEQPKEQPKEDIKEQPKEQPKDSEEKPKEQPKEQPKDSEEKPKEQPKEQPKDSEEKPKEQPK